MEEFLEARSMMAQHLDLLMENLSIRRQATKIDADDLFGSETSSENNFNWNPNFRHLSNFEVLTQEKNSLGIYVSGNPLKNYEFIETWLRENLMFDDIHIILINKVRKIFTKTNSMMFALEISTTKTELEGIIFPKLAPEYSPILEEKGVYFVIGKVNQKKAKKNEIVKSVEEMDIENEGDVEIIAPEEIKEYDELPKLLINGLSKFENGVLDMIQKNETLSFSRINLIEGLNWEEIQKNPLKFQEILQQRSSPKIDAKTLPLQPKLVDQITTIQLPKTLGSEFLSLVQSKVSKVSKIGYKEVELWVEVNGEFKKVKGQMWLDADLINKIRQNS